MSHKDPFITISESASATEILNLFAKGVHRVALKNEKNEVSNVLSQFDFVRYAAANMNCFSELAKTSIKEAGLVQSWVLHVRKTERAFACFRKMVENGVNGVSIIDIEGKLDAHLSSDDLRVSFFDCSFM